MLTVLCRETRVARRERERPFSRARPHRHCVPDRRAVGRRRPSDGSDLPAGHEWADSRAGAEAWLTIHAGRQSPRRGLEATGLQEAALRTLGPDRLGHPLVLAGVTVALSNVVSNVPAVLLFRPLLPHLGPPKAVGLLPASASS